MMSELTELRSKLKTAEDERDEFKSKFEKLEVRLNILRYFFYPFHHGVNPPTHKAKPSYHPDFHSKHLIIYQ